MLARSDMSPRRGSLGFWVTTYRARTRLRCQLPGGRSCHPKKARLQGTVRMKERKRATPDVWVDSIGKASVTFQRNVPQEQRNGQEQNLFFDADLQCTVPRKKRASSRVSHLNLSWKIAIWKFFGGKLTRSGWVLRCSPMSSPQSQAPGRGAPLQRRTSEVWGILLDNIPWGSHSAH